MLIYYYILFVRLNKTSEDNTEDSIKCQQIMKNTHHKLLAAALTSVITLTLSTVIAFKVKVVLPNKKRGRNRSRDVPAEVVNLLKKRPKCHILPTVRANVCCFTIGSLCVLDSPTGIELVKKRIN